MSENTLVLASASPRRLQLLRQLGIEPVAIASPDIDETPGPDESAADLVVRLAESKAEAVAASWPGDHAQASPTAVLAADTVIQRDTDILGKPATCEEFLETFMSLAGRSHEVFSGVAVIDSDNAPRTVLVCTRVQFGPICRAQALAYWRSGEPRDKAGGYAIQGRGARFVAGIQGSYSNVVGLPLYETAGLLAAAGILTD